MKIAVTGANSSVGKNLLAYIAAHTDHEVIAGVRSQSAFSSLPESPRIEGRVISYGAVEDLAKSLAGADCVVHLAGILIEGKGTTYASANVDATRVVAEAAQKIAAKNLVFISVVGASPSSSNAYFRSKGAAEELVSAAACNSSILRTPILLGPGTAGANSLVGAASMPKAKVLGGGLYRMRPLDIDDLNLAILRCCESTASGSMTYELVGPEAISYRDLIQKTAALMNKQVEIGSIPLWVAKLGAAITSRLKGGGITPTVVDVITMDEVVQTNADGVLGITLTPLSETLIKITGKQN